MTDLKTINDKQKEIIDTVIAWQKKHFPSITNNYEKCQRNIGIVLAAYIDDLRHSSTRNIEYVSRRYWWNDTRQIIEYEAELAVHDYMVEYILNNIVPDSPEKNRQQIIKLKNILVKNIINGPEYMNYSHMHKYRYIMEYDTNDVPSEHLIKQCLHEVWETTPSKQQFMPYNVHVLGPGDQKRKSKLYYKSLVREYETNKDRYDVDVNDSIAVEKAMLDHRDVPQYLNFKTAPYILLFSQRVSKLNPFNKYMADRGWNFEQADDSWIVEPWRKNRASGLALIEMGMFSQAFSNLCLMHGIDISHTRCLPTEMEFWQEPEFDFLDTPPQLIMSAGRGIKTRRQFYPEITYGSDHRPDFNEVVKFVQRKD